MSKLSRFKIKEATYFWSAVTFLSLVCISPNIFAANLDEYVKSNYTNEVQTSFQQMNLSPSEAASIPEDQRSPLRRAFDKFSGNFDINLINTQFLPSTMFKLDLKGEVHPSYLQDHYTRIENLIPSIDLNLASLLKIKDSALGIDVTPKITSSFYRQFKTVKDAWDFFGRRNLDNRPYALDHIPTHSQIALNNMKVGDIYNYNNNLTTTISPLSKSFGKILSGNVALSWTVGGQFVLNVTRLPLDHVEVKFIGLKKRGPGYNGELGISPTIATGAHFILWRILGSTISNHWLRWNFLRTDKQGLSDYKLPDMHYGVFIADYIIDLQDPTAAAAYDKIVSSYFIFQDKVPRGPALQRVASIVNPLTQSMTEVSEVFRQELAQLDQIYLEDKHNMVTAGNRRVNRLIQADQDSDQDTLVSRKGSDLIYFNEDQTTLSRDGINIIDDNNQFHHFDHYASVESRVEKRSFGFGHKNEIKTLDAICTAGDIEHDCQMELAFHDELTTTDFKKESQQGLYTYVKNNFPEYDFSQIPWGQWTDGVTKENAYAKVLILFKRNFASQIPETSKVNLNELLLQYLTLKDYTPPVDQAEIDRIMNPNSNISSPEWQVAQLRKKAEEVAQKERMAIVSGLNVILNDKISDKKRMEAIFSLKENSIFKSFGAGFIINLLGPKNTSSFVHTKLKMIARATQTLSWPSSVSSGSIDNVDVGLRIYEAFTTIQNQINRAIDPQLQNENLYSIQR